MYATTAQFAQAGLVRELRTGTGALVYDSNPSRHQHWVDLDTGEVHDLPPGVQLTVTGADALPAGLCVEDVQVMLMVRRQAPAACRATRRSAPQPPIGGVARSNLIDTRPVYRAAR